VCQAARELGRLSQSFCHRLNQEGRTIVRLPSSYRLNPERFETVTTPEVAYVLGLLWADGYLRKAYYTIAIELQLTDMLMVKPTFDKVGDWHYRERTRKGRTRPVACLNVANQRVHELLCSWDYLEKSHLSPTKVLAHIPSSLHPLFWRGYIDGDGSLYQRGALCQMSLAGSFDQDWSAQLAMCEALGATATVQRWTSKQGHRSSCVRITSRFGIERIGDWVYHTFTEDGIGLPRKHAKYLRIKECCNASRVGRYARKYSEATMPFASSNTKASAA
jgi:hypothetical protein